MQIQIHLVKSFTQEKEFGSPTGVVLDTETLTEQQMQSIATELNFAESVFVLPSEKADFKLRFFAPNHEVDLCGHATIASFHALVEQDMIAFGKESSVELVQETRAGILAITCHKDGLIVMEQKEPTFGEIEENKDRIAELLSITRTDFLREPLQVVSTGTPKLLIPVMSLEALRDIRPDNEGIKEYCRSTSARGFYPFTMETPIAGTDFYARQFNPLADENEDAITGVAAGALGCYAQKYKLLSKQHYTVAQGYDLGMGGNMSVDVSNGVRVGGYAVTYGQKIMSI